MQLILSFVIPALALAAIAFSVGAWVGRTTCSRRLAKRRERHDVLQTAAELTMHSGLLEALRKGPAPDWLEVLEFTIDSNVSELWRKLPGMEPFHRDLALGTLRRAKQYRQKWPRQISPVPERLEEHQRSAKEAADEAGKILAGLDAAANPTLQATAAPAGS